MDSLYVTLFLSCRPFLDVITNTITQNRIAADFIPSIAITVQIKRNYREAKPGLSVTSARWCLSPKRWNFSTSDIVTKRCLSKSPALVMPLVWCVLLVVRGRIVRQILPNISKSSTKTLIRSPLSAISVLAPANFAIENITHHIPMNFILDRYTGTFLLQEHWTYCISSWNCISINLQAAECQLKLKVDNICQA